MAVKARNITVGLDRAAVVVASNPGVEITDTVLSLVATGGTAGDFTLTYAGQISAAIAYDATAAAVQSALEALSNIAVGDVTCTGGDLPDAAVTITFGGVLAGSDVILTVTDSITDGTAAITTTTVGGQLSQTPVGNGVEGREVRVHLTNGSANTIYVGPLGTTDGTNGTGASAANKGYPIATTVSKDFILGPGDVLYAFAHVNSVITALVTGQ